MTSCCCSSTVSVILQSCKDQEIFIRCWYVKPYNWKQLLFSELYIYEKLYCRALQLTVFYYVLHLLFIFLDSISWIAIQRLWWTVNEAAAVLDKLQEKDLISNEKFKWAEWEIIQRWALWSPRDKVSEVSHLWAWVISMYCLENVKIWTTF